MCTRTGLSQAGSLRSRPTPAGIGLDHLLYQVWARARQSFSGSAKDSSAFRGLRLKSGNTRPRAESPGEMRESSKAQPFQVCGPEGGP